MGVKRANAPSSGESSKMEQNGNEFAARLRQQAVVAQLGQSALSGKPLEVLMQETVSILLKTLGVDYAYILELLPSGDEFMLRSSAGADLAIRPGMTIAVRDFLIAKASIASKEPIIISDLRKKQGFSIPLLLGDNQFLSGIAIAIRGKDRLPGVLGALGIEVRSYTPEDVAFFLSLANILGSASEHSRAEKELRSSRDQLEIILQGVADGITVQDAQGNLIFANSAAARIIGYASVEELLAAPLQDLMNRFEILDEEGKPFPLDRLPGRMALAGQKSVSAVIRFRVKATGVEHWSLAKATPITNQSGQVEMAVNIFQDITELKRIENTQRILAEAGNLVATSLDYEKTLGNVAELAVKYLADWCAVTVVEENQPPRNVAVAHKDARMLNLARSLQERYPPDWNAQTGIAKVLRTGEPEFYPEISDEALERAARDAEHYQMIRELGFRSGMILPLVARGHILGGLTLVWSESGRKYSPSDVSLAEELARRTALAIDNARLYQDAQEHNIDLEARVAKRTSQLQSIITKLRSEITERRKIEEALRKNETLLKSLFESAPDAIILVNETGIIEDANDQAENIFGYRREELLGSSVDRLLPKRFQRRHKGDRSSYYFDPRRRPMGVGLDLFGRRKDGSEIPVDIMLSPVNTEGGILVISAIRDITERKQMEAELAEVQRQLIESTEAERTYLAQELHDGPIQDLYAITYQMKGLDVQESDLSSQVSATETMEQVITQLRAICGDLRPPALAPFGLEKAILTHLEQVRENYPNLQVEAALMPDGQIIPDRIRLALYRVYQQAVSNVLRHAEANTLSVKLTFDDDEIVLEIKDDGCGFELPRRWVDLARHGHLGLVGTAERTEAIGGQLDIMTAPGKGTLIRVTVPRNERTQKTYRKSLHRFRLT